MFRKKVKRNPSYAAEFTYRQIYSLFPEELKQRIFRICVNATILCYFHNSEFIEGRVFIPGGSNRHDDGKRHHKITRIKNTVTIYVEGYIVFEARVSSSDVEIVDILTIYMKDDLGYIETLLETLFHNVNGVIAARERYLENTP